METLEEINRKLEKENASLKESLEFAHNSIKDLTKRVETEETALSKLTKDINAMSKLSTSSVNAQ